MPYKEDQKLRDEANALKLFLKEFPELNVVASLKLLVEYIRPSAVTLKSLYEARELLGDRLGEKSPQVLANEAHQEERRQAEAAAQERANLIDAIVNNAKRSPQESANRRSQLNLKTTDEIRQIWTNIQNERVFRNMSVEELKAQVRQNNPQHTLPALPDTVTKEVIYRASPETMRMWFQRHGSDAVNARLQGKS